MENKKGNGLTIFLIILVLIFAIVGTLLFTGVIKSPLVKCNEKEVVENNTINDNTKKDTTTVVQKTADERYKEYLTNLANSIKTNYLADADEIKGFTNNNWGSAELNQNLELIARKLNDNTNELDTYKIADNVVSFTATGNGQGAYYSVYYITADGKLYQAKKTDLSIDAYEIKELENKNIIEIRIGSMMYYGQVPIFVDIDGNIQYGISN